MKKNNHTVNYHMFAKQRRELDINITFDNPAKISSLIDNQIITIKSSFSFFEENNTTNIKYSFAGTLPLICQNTLEVFNFEFSKEGIVAIVEDDRFLKNDLYEPFICRDDFLDLKDIIIEEMLLALPTVPKKEGSSCKIKQKHSYYSKAENVIEEKPNPFSVLKDLKF